MPRNGEAFRQWACDEYGSLTAFAAAAKCSRQYASLLALGKCGPGVEWATKIEQLSKGRIPVKYWIRKGKR